MRAALEAYIGLLHIFFLQILLIIVIGLILQLPYFYENESSKTRKWYNSAAVILCTTFIVYLEQMNFIW